MFLFKMYCFNIFCNICISCWCLLALKITQAVLEYNDLHWTMVQKNNSVHGGYSSSLYTQKLRSECRGIAFLDMCSVQFLFRTRKIHLYTEMQWLASAEQSSWTGIQKSYTGRHSVIAVLSTTNEKDICFSSLLYDNVAYRTAMLINF